jgi:hypothetical protein
LKYGIRTYIFCIEPRAWDSDDPVIKKYPELAGAPNGSGYFFCPISPAAHKYLSESVYKIFKAVPELGGMINISHGERGTTCLSSLSCTSDYTEKINCPRCSHKAPWEILHASLSAMEQGMHDAAPRAELISWLYMPQPQRYVAGDSYTLGDWVYELPAHTPAGVILQFNSESGVSRTEFGKLMVGGDYWISNPGPSSRFENVAGIAREHGIQVSAKIQTGNSHEVATVPYVPVPSLLYRKFSAMRNLGVTHTMLCWYFGNYPGLMNKAAGLLSMEPFPKDEETFLNDLASVYWKKEDVPKVVEAWQLFSKGYENYPLVNLFQYYGPMHDGPVWPLLLKPADAPQSPTWQIGSSTTRKPWPPSGDRVGECVGDVLTLGELVELTRRMTASWEKGMTIFRGLKNNYANDQDRLSDIGVAEALNIQFRSGYNILHFYLLREKMLRMEGKERLDLLNQMVDIIEDELALDKQLITLCENDSRLGFHSEAEGYKYFPELIEWRMRQLESVLSDDVPDMRKSILKNELLFSEYTGKKPKGAVADCISTYDSLLTGGVIALPPSIRWQTFSYGTEKTDMQWTSVYSKDNLYVIVSGKGREDADTKRAPVEGIEIKIEPQRLYPAMHFEFNVGYADINTAPVHIIGYPLIFRAGLRIDDENGIWKVAARVPMKSIRADSDNPQPIRMDVIVHTETGKVCSWRPDNKETPRLILGSDNPADLGWLVFL